MTKTIMIVGLKVPDTTAKTALQAYVSQEFKAVKDVRRWTYYEFEHEGDSSSFGKLISKVDILVNHNKNNFKILKSKNEIPSLAGELSFVLVKDTHDKCSGLLTTLKDRLGISGINSMSKGVLWGLKIDGDKSAVDEATKNLLYNPHFQEYEVMK